jgi:hypothetical protein
MHHNKKCGRIIHSRNGGACRTNITKVVKKHNTGRTTNHVHVHLRSMFSAGQVLTTSCNEIVYKVSPREENTCFSFLVGNVNLSYPFQTPSRTDSFLEGKNIEMT